MDSRAAAPPYLLVKHGLHSWSGSVDPALQGGDPPAAKRTSGHAVLAGDRAIRSAPVPQPASPFAHWVSACDHARAQSVVPNPGRPSSSSSAPPPSPKPSCERSPTAEAVKGFSLRGPHDPQTKRSHHLRSLAGRRRTTEPPSSTSTEEGLRVGYDVVGFVRTVPLLHADIIRCRRAEQSYFQIDETMRSPPCLEACFGSLADVVSRLRHVRCSPRSRHSSARFATSAKCQERT